MGTAPLPFLKSSQTRVNSPLHKPGKRHRTGKCSTRTSAKFENLTKTRVKTPLSSNSRVSCNWSAKVSHRLSSRAQKLLTLSLRTQFKAITKSPALIPSRCRAMDSVIMQFKTSSKKRYRQSKFCSPTSIKILIQSRPSPSLASLTTMGRSQPRTSGGTACENTTLARKLAVLIPTCSSAKFVIRRWGSYATLRATFAYTSTWSLSSVRHVGKGSRLEVTATITWRRLSAPDGTSSRPNDPTPVLN